MFTRPARSAGIAVKTATASRISANEASRGRGANADGVGVASTFAIGFSSNGAIAAPAIRPSTPAAAAIARYSPTSSARTPRGENPTAFIRPISRRWASTRPLITVATVKPTANSANNVLIEMISE